MPATKTLDLRRKISQPSFEQIQLAIEKECDIKDDIGVVDISENHFGTNLSVEDFNKLLDYIAGTFSNMHKLALHANRLYQWFESKNPATKDMFSGFRSMNSLTMIDISENGLFLNGLSETDLSIIFGSFPKNLQTIDLGQHPDHASTNSEYVFSDRDLIEIIRIAGEHCTSLQRLFFNEQLEDDLGLDGTGSIESLREFGQEPPPTISM